MNNPSYSNKEINAFAKWYINQYRMRHTDKNSQTEEAYFASKETSFEGDEYDYFQTSNITSKIKLAIILELLAQASNESEISYIAAGELEQLICKHPEIYPELDVEVRRNPNMRDAICGVWTTAGTPEGIWLRQILAKYNLD